MKLTNGEWYHVVLTTYGAWLPGDLRGFRTRHHREHVEGDYRNPPSLDQYAERRAVSRRLLKQPSVTLKPDWKATIGQLLCDKFQSMDISILAVAISGKHAHLLINLPPPEVRRRVGLAKRHCTMAARRIGWKGRLWGSRCKVVRIRSRRHQLNTFRYILEHKNEGAWVRHFCAPRNAS